MPFVKRSAVLTLAAGLALVAGCGTAAPAGQAHPAATPAPHATPPVSDGGTLTPSPGTPAPSRACLQAGAYLVSIRTGQHAGFDRVVFEFSGGLPSYQAGLVQSVDTDPKGDKIPLAGQARLRGVFRGASAWCPQPASKTYPQPAVLTPFYRQLLVVSAAGDFEHVLSFGIGTAARGAYRIYSLRGPDRVVLDVSDTALGRFPGIWGITSWQQYWQQQYAWENGHQPWLSDPASVVAAWAFSRWETTPAIHQTGPGTFRVIESSGRVDTVTGTRPVTVPGPWVITKITYGVMAV